MYLILIISKSKLFRNAAERTCSTWAPGHMHIDFISSSQSFIGYLPENIPSLILIDGDSYHFSDIHSTIPHLSRHYPHTYIILSYSKQMPLFCETTSKILTCPFRSYHDLEKCLLQFLENTKKLLPSVSPKDFFPMEKSMSLLQDLTIPEKASGMRKSMPSTFPLHQFYVCILNNISPSHNNSREYFMKIYEASILQTPYCLMHQTAPHCALLIFYDFTDHIKEFICRRDRFIEFLNTEKKSAANEIKVYLGCIHTNCFGLYKSYFEAKETQYIDKLYLSCLSFEEISSLNKQAAKPMRLMELERIIRANMEYKSGLDLIHYAKLWFKECRNMEYTVEHVQIDLLNLYSIIKYVIFDMYTLQTSRIKKGWESYEIFQIKTIDELEEWFYDWINYTLNNILGKHATQQMRIQDALDFIENHLMENISLESVSSYFFLNPSYFSTIFRQEMNETFLSYTTRRKMHKAAELLQSGRKISDISRLLGYEDNKHFRTLFKKQFLQTPSQYRKMFNYEEHAEEES